MIKSISEEEIWKKEEELERLKREVESLKAQFGCLSPAQKVAEILHESCRLNHTDECGWPNSSWEKPCQMRVRYLAQAQVLLRAVDGDTDKAIQIVRAIS